ncbi:Rv1733c family protein [Streptomyces orinoci]|uniref:Uncharacterized protein n=1 Tax=Streptomyces orinoci TaxID=67339 RepID=A0ABV3K0G9_STRON|nr:hypothetical protein [Streptomyces orinoci]
MRARSWGWLGRLLRRPAWRWRRNPLRRRSDVVEAWLGLVAVVLMLVAGPVAGWASGSLAHGALRHMVRQQRLHRHQVEAVLLKVLPGRPMDTDPQADGRREGHHRVIARWPGPDGTLHTGVVPVHGTAAAGKRFSMWTDDQGGAAGRPLDGATAQVHSVLAGVGAAAATAGVIQGARVLAVRRLVRRRYARWDRDWEQARHTWGRADAGS